MATPKASTKEYVASVDFSARRDGNDYQFQAGASVVIEDAGDLRWMIDGGLVEEKAAKATGKAASNVNK